MVDTFDAFVRVHSRSLFGTAYLLTGSGHAAEELVQDTLAALYPKWDLVQAAQSPVAYVRRALSHRFVSSTRQVAARQRALSKLPDAAASDDSAQRIADRHWLSELLGGLPERQRAALVLRYFHDLSDTEIASCLGCRRGTVRSLVSRGLGNIRFEAGWTVHIEGSPR